MVVVTGGIFKKSMAIGTFDRGTVRGTGGVGQTKRATMRAGGTMVFDISVSHITMITIILILGHPGHRKNRIVMLVVV
jgi:hypothetical protein